MAQVPIEVVKAGLKIYWLPEGATVTVSSRDLSCPRLSTSSDSDHSLSLQPGLIDSHGHILEYGHWKSSVGLVGSSSVDG